MKIVITGATGFVGRWLVKAISDKELECVAIIRPDQRLFVEADPLFRNIERYSLEMIEYNRIGELIPDADCLINLSWAGSRGKDRMDHDMQEHNYLCSMGAINSMAKTACKCIVTAGSQAEYGHITGGITEKTIPQPNTEYGKYKLKLYEDASDYCEKYGIRFIEPRYFSLYGPHDTDRTMIISILKRMLHNMDCELTESVQMWDFLYIEDAMDALIKLINSDSCNGVYNFASGDCRALKEFIEEMKLVIGSTSNLVFGAVPYPSTGMVSIQPDISKLKATIGWNAKTTFEEGIRRVVESL